MSIRYKYFGISEEDLLVLLLSGDLLGDLRLSKEPDLPLVPLPDGSCVFLLDLMNS
jgi:hypothetical protein